MLHTMTTRMPLRFRNHAMMMRRVPPAPRLVHYEQIVKERVARPWRKGGGGGECVPVHWYS